MKITVARRCKCGRITTIEVEEEPFTRFINGEKDTDSSSYVKFF